MGPIPVDDPADPRLADYVGLTDAELRRRPMGAFVVEGELAIRQLLRSRYAVRSVLLTPAMHSRLEAELATIAAPSYVASREVMGAVAGFDIHRGAIAAAARPPPLDPAELVVGCERIAVLEGVNDHENLGAVFRNAAAFDVGGVLMSPTCADPLYRRSVRVSLGHVLRVPFARAERWPAELAALRRDGWTVAAMTPSRDAHPVWALDGRSERTAVVLGAEGPGLTAAALDACTMRVRVPMVARVDSLNVATAAAIAFHCLARPR